MKQAMSAPTRLCSLCIGAGLASAALCAPAAGQQAPAGRCYTLTFGPWSKGDEPLTLYQPLPEIVELRDSVAVGRGRWPSYAAQRWPIDQLRRRASWLRVTADTVRIRFPSSWSTGVIVDVPTRGDTLRGEARVYVDYEPFAPPPRTVALIRTECPRSRAASQSR